MINLTDYSFITGGSKKTDVSMLCSVNSIPNQSLP